MHRTEAAHAARAATLGELAAGLAHELNQPLGAILTNVQAARRLIRLVPPQTELLSEILEDVAADDLRASEVIKRMRALLRKGELNLQPVDLNEITHDVLRLIASDAILRQVRVMPQLEPDLPGVVGDRVQLQQVILNLLVNSMEAMTSTPMERRRLVVRTSLPRPHVVQVAVQDEGQGFSPEVMRRMYDPFFSTKSDGLGMGLSISRSIIDAHGGRIRAYNNPSGGAIVSFTLPGLCDRRGRGRPADHERYHCQGVRNRWTAHKPTVFLVDDDASFRRALERLLNAAGYDGRVLRVGHRVHEPSGTGPVPGACSSTCACPDLTGLEVQELITTSGVPTPIVFMTGYADVATCVQAMKGGAADFLIKPFQEAELLDAVERGLEKDRERRSEREQEHQLDDRLAQLTPREYEVFRLVAKGMLNKQIAGVLGTKEGTVKMHRGHVMRKLELGSVAELVSLAHRLHLDDPRPDLHARAGRFPSPERSGAASDRLKAVTRPRSTVRWTGGPVAWHMGTQRHAGLDPPAGNPGATVVAVIEDDPSFRRALRRLLAPPRVSHRRVRFSRGVPAVARDRGRVPGPRHPSRRHERARAPGRARRQFRAASDHLHHGLRQSDDPGAGPEGGRGRLPAEAVRRPVADRRHPASHRPSGRLELSLRGHTGRRFSIAAAKPSPTFSVLARMAPRGSALRAKLPH